MTWNDCLALGQTKLAKILGCSTSTVDSWINRGGPPEWQRRFYIAEVVAKLKAKKE